MTRHAVTGAVIVTAVNFVFVAVGVGLLLSPVIALTAFAFWRLVEPEESGSTGYKMVALITAIGTTVATIVAVLAGFMPLSSFEWLAILAATGLSAAIFSLTFTGRAAPCRLCGAAIAAGAGFECPRCFDRICSRPSCWNGKHARCTRCLERGVVALPMQPLWWKTRFGRKAGRGQCAYCFKQAEEANLYECGHCAQALCDRCWDHQNASCSRCGWVIPNAPEKLLAAVRAGKPKSARAGKGDRSRSRASPAGSPVRRPPVQDRRGR
jgi:hypothetical protein